MNACNSIVRDFGVVGLKKDVIAVCGFGYFVTNKRFHKHFSKFTLAAYLIVTLIIFLICKGFDTSVLG